MYFKQLTVKSIIQMIENPGEVIIFEDKEFRLCKDESGLIMFDTYVLKSEGSVMKFSKENFTANVITAKFPLGFYGYGYSGTALRNNRQCYCHGELNEKTFKTEFEAQIAAINYILKHELSSGWHQHFIKLQMNEFVNPKTLF